MDMSGVNSGGANKALDARVAHLCGLQKKGGGRNAITASKQQIPKKKFIEGECYIQIMPAILSLPFNPANYMDDEYNNESRFLFKNMSAYSGVKFLKALMVNDLDMAEYAAQIMGVDVSQFELSDPEVSPAVQAIFKRYRTVDITSYPVQKMKFSDPAFKFGRYYRVDVDLDGEGNPILDNLSEIPLSVRLYQMENALIATQNKLRTAEYESGEQTDRTTKELEEANKAAWKNRLIGNPHSFGVVRSVIIVTDREFSPTPEIVTAMGNAANYFPFENYTGINGNFVKEEIEAKAGSKKDRYFDFFAIRVECKSKMKPDETLLEVVTRTTRALCSADEEFTDKLVNFEDKYRAYRDEESFWKPEILEKSVINFRRIDDDTLLQRMQDDISRYQEALGAADVAEQFGALISTIDAQLGSKLLMMNEAGESRRVGLTEEDLAMAPKDVANDTILTLEGDTNSGGIDLEALTSLMAEADTSAPTV